MAFDVRTPRETGNREKDLGTFFKKNNYILFFPKKKIFFQESQMVRKLLEIK